MSTIHNPERVRQSVRVSFDGTTDEVAVELVQNALRAGARTLRVSIRPSEQDPEEAVLFVHNDGRMAPDPAPFLAIAGSGWGAAVEAEQKPMGVGFHSLLALKGVREVAIASGTWRLAVPTAEWWAEGSDLWKDEVWPGRLVSNGRVPVAGVAITAVGEKQKIFELFMSFCYNRSQGGMWPGFWAGLRLEVDPGSYEEWTELDGEPFRWSPAPYNRNLVAGQSLHRICYHGFREHAEMAFFKDAYKKAPSIEERREVFQQIFENTSKWLRGCATRPRPRGGALPPTSGSARTTSGSRSCGTGRP